LNPGLFLFTLAWFRARTRRRFLLQFGLIVINGGTDELFESRPIHLIALEQIDRSIRVAFNNLLAMG
jgi:hypothetical protein